MNVLIVTPGGRRTKETVLTLAALVTMLLVSYLAVSAEPAEAQDACGSIQVRVDAAPDGATIDLPDGCVYREAVTLRRPVTLVGGPGTEIRGSDVWGEWTENSSGYWVSDRSVPVFEEISSITDPQHPYPCKDGTSRCKWPAQVFLDGQPLLQVASNPQSGQFALTGGRQVILADDPTGHEAEVTVRDRWIGGRSGGVTIEGFTMKHAANGLSNTAIDSNGRQNWTIRDNDLSYAHAAILSLGGASGLRIEGNDVHHGGLLGISSASADLTVLNNQVHHNNTEAFYPAWKSAGMKIANASSVTATGNVVYDNDQTGIWIDNGSENVILSDNRVHHNVKRGIHIEVSDHAEVFGNVVYENGWGTFVDDASGNEGVGISTTASRGVQIYNNTLAWNASGVTVVNSKREHGTGGSDPIFSTVSDVLVHHNTIVSEAFVAGSHRFALVWRKAYTEGNIYDPAANNLGYDNLYWYPSQEDHQFRFIWDGRFRQLGDFNATPGEERGRYLSDAEKDQTLAAESVPANPDHERDGTPPAPPVITDPAGGGYVGSRSFRISGTAEAGSTIKLREGGILQDETAADAAGNWSVDLGNVPEGQHAYSVEASDQAGNASVATRLTVTVDTQSPATTIDSGPSGSDNDASPSFAFSSNEVNAIFECSLDTEPFAGCASPKEYADLAQEEHTFRVRAVDPAGNTDSSPASTSWTLDLVAPEAPTITGPPQNSYEARSFTVSGTAVAHSTVELFDGATTVGTGETSAAGSWSVALAAVEEGKHAYTAKAIDAAGNVSTASGSRTINVDVTAPRANVPTEGLVLDSTLGTADVPVRLDWAASDAGSGVARYELERSVNGGPYSRVSLHSPTMDTFILPLGPGRTHRFRVRAVDGVGNVGAWVTGRDFTLAVYQENDPRIGYPTGNWTTAALAGAHGGRLKYASVVRAEAKITFAGREVALVSRKASGNGPAHVFVDGVKVETVSLNSATQQASKVVFRAAGLARNQHHTLKVWAAGNMRVDVDAFVVLN